MRVVCRRSGSGSRQQALPIGGATVTGSFRRHGPFAAGAVGGGHVLNRVRGHVYPDDAGVAVVPPSNRGAAAAHFADRSGPVAAVGLSRCRSPPSIARCGWLEALALVAHDGPGSPHQVAAVRWRAPRRHATGVFNTSGFLRGAVVRAQSTNGLTRHVRGERLASSRGRRVGLRHRGHRSAPLSGSFMRRGTLGRSAWTRLI